MADIQVPDKTSGFAKSDTGCRALAARRPAVDLQSNRKRDPVATWSDGDTVVLDAEARNDERPIPSVGGDRAGGPCLRDLPDRYDNEDGRLLSCRFNQPWLSCAGTSSTGISDGPVPTGLIHQVFYIVGEQPTAERVSGVVHAAPIAHKPAQAPRSGDAQGGSLGPSEGDSRAGGMHPCNG